MLVNFTARGTGAPESDRLIRDIAAAFKRIERFAGVSLGYAPLDADGLIPVAFLAKAAELALTPSTLHVTGTSAANAPLTVTLPAVAGKSHFITSIRLVRASTAAVAGGALLTQTSTNLPGSPAWVVGSALVAGQAVVDLDYSPTTPLRSLAAGIPTTIAMVACGVAAVNNINVSYYVA